MKLMGLDYLGISDLFSDEELLVQKLDLSKNKDDVKWKGKQLYITDNNGKTVDFKSCILIMTSNAGATELSKSAIGFAREGREGADTEAVERIFTPEFRNRLDAIIPFSPLSLETMMHVVDKFIMQLEAQLQEKGVSIILGNKAKEWLAERGYEPTYGARPLARVVQEHIKKPLADMILFGVLTMGGEVFVDVQNNKITTYCFFGDCDFSNFC